MSAKTDYTGSANLRRLYPDTEYAYRVWCVTHPGHGKRGHHTKKTDRSAIGEFKTAPAPRD